MSKSEKTVVGAVARIAEKVYDDVAGPSAKRVGQSFDDLLKIALTPADVVNWGYEKSKAWLQELLKQRTAQIPKHRLIPPSDRIAIPVVVGIAASGEAPEIRNLYAELLLKAMDRATVDQVHPAYVVTVGQLTPQEALVLIGLRDRVNQNLFQERESSMEFTGEKGIDQQFKEYCISIGLDAEGQSAIWLENLRRLGLLWTERLYDVQYFEKHQGLGRRGVAKNDYRNLRFTEFGKRFLAACEPPSSTGEV
jgi:hypothetical protein